MKHLHDKTKDIINNYSDSERVMSIKKPKWIGYSQANSILSRFDELLNYPVNHRMPNILLVGDSNNGKTALLNKFLKVNQSFVEEETSKLVVPVLLIQAPPEPDERRFYNTILESLFAPYNSSEKIEMKQQRVIHLLKKVELRLLIIDEIHHVLAGNLSKQRSFLNVLKFLSNELRISMVCSGTKEAFNAIQTDPQLANRFEPKVLKKWRNDEEYLRLLASFERLLPLKEESLLIEPSISTKILAMSEGLIGEISRILELSSILAIESGLEKINKNILNNIDFVPPSDRKKMIFKL
ncbi:TniB family NTP-binding protein [Flavobacterium sp. FPG59]|uniref:TniB family NTP-binding protein n=1 Tax=Flavobacterium sp. FPG59 TaxID=1929267 RepID=UPI000A37B51C|nr:TniB family NTP-binding protein [Flavobacterium sp. FPG59]OUD34751.1 AAA family ATPase [Flavobacterium sp. FPG59]